MTTKEYGFSTIAVHGHRQPGKHEAAGPIRPVSTPIVQSSTFSFESAEQGARIFAGEEKGYYYTRMGNPTTAVLERTMASLEGGEDALAFASGLAATVASIFAVTRSGEEIIASNTLYGGTHGLFAGQFPNFNIKAIEIDGTNPDNFEKAMTDKTRLIFIETPANPTLTLIDIEKVADIAHRHNIPLIVDNTFCTPFYQRPLELGADVVLHSATKYISGHGDTVAGILVGGKEYIQKVRSGILKDFGATISPFNSWLLLRGLRTLPVRMQKHTSSAIEIARYLSSHSKIDKVHYPGLETHPQYELANKQMSGYSGVIAFILKGGREAGRILMNKVNLWTLAVSLGDVDSLIQHPATMTHVAYSEDELQETGITGGLVRLSVGLEDTIDLIEDLDQALDQI
ncbi:MAG: aminotransferase class I/II-fold pyridoxal phosphate-dependent enzyme [Candidatus Latescibacterota bacterium]